MAFNIGEYEKLIDGFHKIMQENIEIADIKLSADRWTLKEMVSHLIDSASNNHQRFIRLQLEAKISFPLYEAESWKNATKIGGYNAINLINLWKEYNYFLLHIIKNIDDESQKHIWEIGNERKTLKYLVEDYFSHINWHTELYQKRVDEIKRLNSARFAFSILWSEAPFSRHSCTSQSFLLD
ncbi:MAG: hypothetical protein LBQ52_00250 [Helicobacteraceae bacterium]|jgi:hypothetical protein|nr:hypothetical protein [Helicobacteraceae bacterium]